MGFFWLWGFRGLRFFFWCAFCLFVFVWLVGWFGLFSYVCVDFFFVCFLVEAEKGYALNGNEMKVNMDFNNEKEQREKLT